MQGMKVVERLYLKRENLGIIYVAISKDNIVMFFFNHIIHATNGVRIKVKNKRTNVNSCV